ncbi:c-type cytochrome [Marinospirillum perlucidum]|uniref:c-type cytochrome n=1 Tax=Marinospirillum perlucidum TaxID=1982602 RepID=UPI001FE4C4CB|nr:c-type cytochrome [Marinospirillum perlucidum]
MKQRIQVTRILAAAVFGLGALLALQAQATTGSAEEIAERLKPAGELCLEGMDCGGAAVAEASGPARSGDEVYSAVCAACHDTGAAGAPKKGDAAAWSDRLNKSMDELASSVINGLGAMPPRGGSNASDEEIMNAVEFLVEASQ